MANPTTNAIAATDTSKTIAPANSRRKALSVMNRSAGTLHLSFAETATADNAFIDIAPGAFMMFDSPYIPTGNITGLWSLADGQAQVTEFLS